jgi:hypothetical protein
MKKTLAITAALGLISASPLMALDLYITGATAFRANVHDACTKLFDNLPVDGSTLRYGSGTHNNGNAQWTMTGTVSNKISALGTTPLTIHAVFTGSVQGNQAVVTPGSKQVFLDTAGNLITNTPTIAYSDCASASTPYPATGNYSEETVAIQPFVVIRSAQNNTNITNLSWEQLRYGSQAGRIPLSSFTGKAADRTTFVYQLERTKDSGTRRNQFAAVQFGFNQSATVYNYDVTNNVFYKATNTLWALNGGNSNGVVSYGVVGGSPGFNNANANSTWGSGYVGGGDLRTAAYINNPANLSIGVLSFADAKSAISGTNWPQVISFGGLWPTAAGIGIRGNTGTNDFSPITSGSYGLWGNEVCIYPTIDPSTISSDQNLSAALLGNQSTAGTILGVLNAVTVGTPVAGSIDAEIENSKVAGATAIRVNDMVSARSSVGGTITP